MEEFLDINSFAKGINEFTTEALISQDEAVYSRNMIIDKGSLKVESIELDEFQIPTGKEITRIVSFYTNTEEKILLQSGSTLYNSNGTVFVNLFNSLPIDYVNFHHNGKKVIIGNNGTYPFIINDSGGISFLFNRRPVYKPDGTLDYYTNETGQHMNEQQSQVTRAPVGNLIELYQDRLWVTEYSSLRNTERLYFSTSGVNGSDINDWQMPIEENEANQHGGFIDVRSYDGSGIIGLKSAFDALYVFKKNSIYKIIGSTPDDFQMVQVSESNGTIADRSIVYGDNQMFYLSRDGIFAFDGTNATLISAKIQNSLGGFRGYKEEFVTSLFHDRKYYLSIPIGVYTQSERSYLIEYDTDLKSYMIHEYGGLITDMKVINNEVCISIKNKVKSILTDNATGCKTAIWETPFYDYGTQNSKKNTTYVYFRGWGRKVKDRTVPSVVQFELISDRKSKIIKVPLTEENKIYKKKLKNKGRYFKLKITNPEDCHFEIAKVQLIAEIDID